MTYEERKYPNGRIEQDIEECYDDIGEVFDWDAYQVLCDIADYWNMEE